MNNKDKMIMYILLAITFPILIYVMISNNIKGFLAVIIGVVYAMLKKKEVVK